MTNPRLNLKYASNKSLFFSLIDSMRSEISEYKNETDKIKFTTKDETEIGRLDGYAFFPELKEQVEQLRDITTEDFRKSLASRGITDTKFQNKILCMTLQTHCGLLVPMNSILQSKMDIKKLKCEMKDVSLEVNDHGCITFVYNFLVSNYNEIDKPGMEANVKIDSVVIKDFSLIKLYDTPEISEFYNAMKANQQNILMQLITFIRHVFGFNSELRLEEKQKDNEFWSTTEILPGPKEPEPRPLASG